MRSDTVFPLAFLIGATLVTVFLRERFTRGLRPPDRAPVPKSPRRTGPIPDLLCVLLGATGAIWMIPWATVAHSARLSDLFPGVLFAVLLVVGALYALRATERRE